MRLLWIAAGVAAIFAAVSAVVWWRGADAGTERDAALHDASVAIATVNTLDYRYADDGLRRWRDVATGSLLAELEKSPDGGRGQITQAKTVTTGKVLDAALTELDTSGGRASVIAAVEIVVTPDGGTPTTKRARMRADLARTDSGWKLDTITQVPAPA